MEDPAAVNCDIQAYCLVPTIYVVCRPLSTHEIMKTMKMLDSVKTHYLVGITIRCSELGGILKMYVV